MVGLITLVRLFLAGGFASFESDPVTSGDALAPYDGEPARPRERCEKLGLDPVRFLLPGFCSSLAPDGDGLATAGDDLAAVDDVVAMFDSSSAGRKARVFLIIR